MADQLVCPECGNTDLDTLEVATSIKVELLSGGTFGSLQEAFDFLCADPYDNAQPITLLEQKYLCTECGHEWEVAS